MARGVHYNIDNVVNKENKDNTLSMTNGFPSPFSGVVTDVTPTPTQEYLASGHKAAENASSQCDSAYCTPSVTESLLCQDHVQRAMVQLYDNGEHARQRYKLKIGIDLVDGSRVEFIASLTKDFRNFKKYIPESCRAGITNIATEFRRKIRAEFNTYPYLGKLHMNQGRGKNVHSQIEPNTFTAVWYDSEEKGWCGEFMIYDWCHRFDLFDTYVTEKQKKTGLKCQDTYVNPQHDLRPRPKTWAQQRQSQ